MLRDFDGGLAFVLCCEGCKLALASDHDGNFDIWILQMPR